MFPWLSWWTIRLSTSLHCLLLFSHFSVVFFNTSIYSASLHTPRPRIFLCCLISTEFAARISLCTSCTSKWDVFAPTLWTYRTFVSSLGATCSHPSQHWFLLASITDTLPVTFWTKLNIMSSCRAVIQSKSCCRACGWSLIDILLAIGHPEGLLNKAEGRTLFSTAFVSMKCSFSLFLSFTHGICPATTWTSCFEANLLTNCSMQPFVPLVSLFGRLSRHLRNLSSLDSTHYFIYSVLSFKQALKLSSLISSAINSSSAKLTYHFFSD